MRQVGRSEQLFPYSIEKPYALQLTLQKFIVLKSECLIFLMKFIENLK